MEVEKLYDLYNNNIGSVVNSSMLGTIADRRYDIHGYNLVNRILIYIQNKYTTSVKGEAAWSYIGRQVKDRVSPIWIIDNVTKSTLVDADTGETIDKSELTPAEIDEAIRLGTIEKVEEVISIKTVPVFNIKDTVVTDSKVYKAFNKRKTRSIRISSLLEAVNNYFDVPYIRSNNDKSFFDYESGYINIGSDSVITKLEVISSGLFNSLGFRGSYEDLDLSDSIDECTYERLVDICEIFLKDSLLSYYDDEHNVESSNYKDIDDLKLADDALNIFLAMLTSVYDLVESVLDILNPNNNEGFSEITLRKAAELLNILEANEATHLFRV